MLGRDAMQAPRHEYSRDTGAISPSLLLYPTLPRTLPPILLPVVLFLFCSDFVSRTGRLDTATAMRMYDDVSGLQVDLYSVDKRGATKLERRHQWEPFVDICAVKMYPPRFNATTCLDRKKLSKTSMRIPPNRSCLHSLAHSIPKIMSDSESDNGLGLGDLMPVSQANLPRTPSSRLGGTSHEPRAANRERELGAELASRN